MVPANAPQAATEQFRTQLRGALIAPGDPLRSVLYYRMSHRGDGQMPPTSTNRIDYAGASLMREWIKQLQPHAVR